MNRHTSRHSSFPMETKIETAEAYVGRIVKPIFDEVAQEAISNRMLVGHIGSKKMPICMYQPHNYRLYFDFRHPERSTSSSIKIPRFNALGGFLINAQIVNRTEKLYLFKNFTIRIKTQVIEITNKLRNKKWYRVRLEESGKSTIKKIIEKKDKEAISFLKKFIKVYGGHSEFNILNRHSENKLRQETSIDKIPLKQKWHTPIAKKVYNDRNVEFSSPAFASNYVVNRGVEEVTPAIVQSLDNMAAELQRENPLRTLKAIVKTPQDLIKHKDLVKLLSEKEKEDLSTWTFQNMARI